MAVQLLKTPLRYADASGEAPVLLNFKDSTSPEDREIVLRNQRVPFSPVTMQERSIQGPEQTLRTVKRLREHENALSSKIIRNLQTDKAAIAAKLEVMQSLLSQSNERCAGLESSARELQGTKDQQAALIQELQGEVQRRQLQEQQAEMQMIQQSQAIADLNEEIAKLRPNVTSLDDVRLLKLAKRYLKSNLEVREGRAVQLGKKADCCPIESLVTNCHGCDRRFGAFTWRYQCRRCAKCFCAICCASVPDFSHDKGGNGPRQRCCRECFKLQEETESKKQQLQQSLQADLRALEELTDRGEVCFDGLDDDEVPI